LGGWLWLSSKNKISEGNFPTWGCGFQKPNRRMVYSAAGFTQFAQDTLFADSLSPHNEIVTSPDLFRKTGRFTQSLGDPLFNRFFAPLFANLSSRAHRFHKLQAGKLNIYLLYIFIATILLIGLDIYQNLRGV